MNKKLLKELESLTSPKFVKFFPASLFMLVNKDFKTDNKKLIKSINAHREKNKKGLSKSNYGGYHSEINIHGLSDFKKIATKFINSYAAIVSIHYGYECIKDKKRYNKIKQSLVAMWYVVNNKNDGHTIHSHPRAWLAFSYYIKLPEKNNIICFHDPIQARRQDGDQADFTSVVNVNEGDILFFPGWFEHSVPSNSSEEDRMVISGNFKKPQFVGK